MLFNKCAIVFQGNFDQPYHNNIIQKYKNFDNVIFSSWDYCELNLIDCKHKILNTLPPIYGNTNINLQIITTLSGIRKAKSLGYSHVLKVRSDLNFDIRQLTELLNEAKIYFTEYHNWSGGYLCEHMVFGDVNYMEHLWDIGLFNDDIFPERHITNRFEQLNNFNIDYIFPLLYKYDIKVYWEKRNFYLNEYQHDSLFVYDMYKEI